MGFKSFLTASVTWAEPMDEVLAKIAECNEKGCNQLRLGGIKGLTFIPEQVLDVVSPDSLDLLRLEITDLSPLAKMPWLKNLNLSETAISDLSPLAKLPVLGRRPRSCPRPLATV